MGIMDEDFDTEKTENPFGNQSTGDRSQQEIKDTIVRLRSENNTFKHICSEVKIHWMTVHTWKQQDPEFRKALEWAEEARTDALENSMMQHATTGFERVVVSGGRVVMDPDDQSKPLVEKIFDNGLRQFLLKGRDRKYGDKVDTNANITVRSDAATADLEAAIAAVSARAQAGDSSATEEDTSES